MKTIGKGQYQFLKKELWTHKENNIITENQYNQMMSTYEEKEGLNFIKVILSVGAVLIGLGILSFIASNWAYMSKSIKMMIIFFALGSTLFASYKTDITYPRISKALLYLVILIYGGGIFLIGQIFHLGGTLSNAFLLWAVGVMVITFISEDIYTAVFSNLLGLIYISSGFEENIIIQGLILGVLMMALNKYFNYHAVTTFSSNLYSLFFVLYLLNYIHLNALTIAGLFLVIGLMMYYIKHKLNAYVFKLQGLLIMGISGLILTIDEVWKEVIRADNAEILAVVFGIVFIIYLLSLVHKQLLIPLVITCITIMRYYFDTMYNFLPKSMFFIVGGVILLGFGIYFERVRKHRGGELDEDAAKKEKL